MAVVDINWLEVVVTVAVFTVLGFAGLLRPTGLFSRTPAQREEDRRRAIAEEFFKKQDPQ